MQWCHICESSSAIDGMRFNFFVHQDNIWQTLPLLNDSLLCICWPHLTLCFNQAGDSLRKLLCSYQLIYHGIYNVSYLVKKCHLRTLWLPHKTSQGKCNVRKQGHLSPCCSFFIWPAMFTMTEYPWHWKIVIFVLAFKWNSNMPYFGNNMIFVACN